MKSFYKFSLILAALVFSSAVFAQGTLKGTVIDIDGNEGLPGASVTIKGTTTGAITDMNGNFTIKAAPASGAIVIKFVGYNTITRAFAVASGETTNLGKIGMASNSTLLGDVTIVGIADVAKDRKTPVAVSTIKAAEIQDKLGSQELPEILNNTPSVYATKAGGGFGDSRINIRGFSQENIAVMINGVPVNDMENGAVYWSNWSGLADVTTGMQVQRGLGSSKLAISSVGGTINILTKTTDAKKGGSIGAMVGNDGYTKFSGSYSTGKLDNGLAVSALFSRTAGDGYANATKFEGYNYFLGIGWENEKNNVQFTVTGAPQVHNQRTSSFFNMATLQDYVDHGTRYNYNQGELNGEEFNWRRNFYHKPVTSINWDLEVSEKSKISTVLYASYGRGGGTGDLGRLNGKFASDGVFRDADGNVLYDNIAASNGGTDTEFIDLDDPDDSFTFSNSLDSLSEQYIVNDDGITTSEVPGSSRRNGVVRRASINSHNWVGAISNFNTQLTDRLVLDVGIDVRSYRGIHYRRLDNLLGSDGYRDEDNVNDPYNIQSDVYESDLSSLWNVFNSTDDENKVNYHNDGLVKWLGAFSQLEYSVDDITIFLQGGVSNQSFKREEFFRYEPSDSLAVTDWVALSGGNIKGGLNYNIDETHNVYGNIGYYSKQPNFDAVFPGNNQFLNEEDLQNEKVFGLELGYGLRSSKFSANVNLYRTSWKNRYLPVFTEFTNVLPDSTLEVIPATGVLYDAEQVHTGFEFDGIYRASEKVKVMGMLSAGNWQYGGSPEVEYQDDDGNVAGTRVFELDGVKVGDAAQFTTRIGVDYMPIEGLKVDASWRYIDNLYSRLNLGNETEVVEALQLPSYNLLDAGVSYKLKLGDDDAQALSFRLNVNNVLNTEYISESVTNDVVEDDTPSDQVFDGINTSNKVFFGFGSTWNFGVRYNF